MTVPPPPPPPSPAPHARPALDRLLSPRSIAMVGASNSLTRIGGTVFGNLLRAFPGEVHPYTPRTTWSRAGRPTGA